MITPGQLGTLPWDWVFNKEVHAVLLACLCSLGLWVIVSWIIQFVWTILWPILAVGLLLTFMPSWRTMLAYDFVPNQLAHLKDIGWKFAPGLNYSLNTLR